MKPGKYVLTNTTVKPPRPGKNGQDTRSLAERNGYNVSYRDHRDNVVLLRPGEHKIVGDVPPNVYSLINDRLLSYRELGSVEEELSKHTYGSRRERRGVKKAEAPVAESAPQRGGKRTAQAKEMGQVNYGDTDHPESGAVNPDGPPNFIVKAPSASTRKRARQSA